MKAQKWDFEKKKYFNYELPELAVLLEPDLDLEVGCASCGKKVKFGDCYTSKQIHNSIGFGYAVCEDCYNKELELERKSKKDICPYCGKKEKKEHYQELCQECQMDFGHKLITEL